MRDSHEPDNLYQSSYPKTHRFEFDASVARVFPDMIQRSVPGYAQTLAMAGIIAARYAKPSSNLYDLGCSLGAVSLVMRSALSQSGCKIVAVDSSEAMIERAGHYLALADDAKVNVKLELECADLLSFPLNSASVSVLNYVLQFIEPAHREALLKRIYEATLPEGVLILSEKVQLDEPEFSIQKQLHEDFKRANGYSELEIAQKRSAIENVLIPESEHTHIERLKSVGFSKVIRWHQCFNFISFLAIK